MKAKVRVRHEPDMNHSAPDLVEMCVTGDVRPFVMTVSSDCASKCPHIFFSNIFLVAFMILTYICVLVSGDGDELCLGENEGLSFGREEGVLRTVLLHLHHVQARLVLVQRLEDDHLSRGE